MPEAIPPEGASWNQEGAFYGQEATMPEAPKPVRCCFKGKTGAFYGQDCGRPFHTIYSDFGIG